MASRSRRVRLGFWVAFGSGFGAAGDGLACCGGERFAAGAGCCGSFDGVEVGAAGEPFAWWGWVFCLAAAISRGGVGCWLGRRRGRLPPCGGRRPLGAGSPRPASFGAGRDGTGRGTVYRGVSRRVYRGVSRRVYRGVVRRVYRGVSRRVYRGVVSAASTLPGFSPPALPLGLRVPILVHLHPGRLILQVVVDHPPVARFGRPSVGEHLLAPRAQVAGRMPQVAADQLRGAWKGCAFAALLELGGADDAVSAVA